MAIKAIGMGVLMVVSLGLAARARYWVKRPVSPVAPAIPAEMPPDALHHSDWRIRTEAVKRLSSHDADLPALLAAIQDKDYDVREAAAEKLAQFGRSAVPGLLAVLESTEQESRESILKLLGEIGDAAAVPGLIAALTDYSRWIRLPAVMALGKIGDVRAKSTLETVAENDVDDEIRAAATDVLTQLR